MRFVLAGNLARIPAVVFPVGFDPEARLPIAAQSIARAWDEETLLVVAAFADQELRPAGVSPQVQFNTLKEKRAASAVD